MKKVIVEAFILWQDQHPEEDYQYDEIFEFLSAYGRGEMLSLLNELKNEYLNK